MDPDCMSVFLLANPTMVGISSKQIVATSSRFIESLPCGKRCCEAYRMRLMHAYFVVLAAEYRGTEAGRKRKIFSWSMESWESE